MRTCATLLALAPLLVNPAVAETPDFGIHVVDEETGRGVPLVELRTVHNVRYYTDSAGWVAFDEPGLMNQEVFFFVSSDGYEFPADGFGMHGTRFMTTPGGEETIKIKRRNVAERLYRVTGGGIYRDSVLLGKPTPIDEPLLNGLVIGQDSVFTIVHAGRVYWFWGDTSWPRYPLGNFQMSGATSLLPNAGGLDPAVGIDLTYFVNDAGFSRKMAPMSDGGAIWADAFVDLREKDGRRRMYAAYAKILPGSMNAVERGLMVLNDETQTFEEISTFPLDTPVFPSGRALKVTDGENEYVFFSTAYPFARVRATPREYCRLDSCEAFTCLLPQRDGDNAAVDRGKDGKIRYAWKHGVPALTPAEQGQLIKSGQLKPGEALLQMRDVDSGKPVLVHNGSVYWNACRQRWVMIFCEQFGTSMLGETWYAEADTPLGPWVYARKVVTHAKYSFYNPKQHPMFDQDSGRIIYFEGTYSVTFSGNDYPTPRYDYNQIMYRLDLSDPRLNLPVPIYRVVGDAGGVTWCTARTLADHRGKAELAFFALDRACEGAVPVVLATGANGESTLQIVRDADENVTPLCYAYPPSAKARPAACVPYARAGDDASPEFCVWPNPMDVEMPWRELRALRPAD